jgi:hypothetical protein
VAQFAIDAVLEVRVLPPEQGGRTTSLISGARPLTRVEDPSINELFIGLGELETDADLAPGAVGFARMRYAIEVAPYVRTHLQVGRIVALCEGRTVVATATVVAVEEIGPSPTTVEVSTLMLSGARASARELLALADERNEAGFNSLWVTHVGSDYPLLTVHLNDDLAVVLRIDKDPIRSDGFVEGSETFIACGDGSVPSSSTIAFRGPGDLEDYTGDVILRASTARSILQAFAQGAAWPVGVEWIVV